MDLWLWVHPGLVICTAQLATVPALASEIIAALGAHFLFNVWEDFMAWVFGRNILGGLAKVSMV